MDYKPEEIEKNARKIWDDEDIYKVSNDSPKPKYYVLDMFPYPSGSGLHVGHPLGYIASDIFSRYKRLKGFNVLHPMGWDAFGLPAEQYAIQTGQHPAITTEQNIARYRKQMDMLGLSYDWSRELKTSDPAFYKWTQWIFLKLFKSWFNTKTNKAEPIESLIHQLEQSGTSDIHAACGEQLNFSAEEWNSYPEKKKSDVLFNYRLAYLSEAMVNWCPALGTVLANDEVKDGVSERGGYPVERKLMPQWSLRMTAYADRLLNDLDTLDWSDSMKEAQRNWIGRSEGCSLEFKVESVKLKVLVFTTRPDTVFGVTFITLAPENELVQKITTAEQKNNVDAYVQVSKNRTERERQAEVKKVTGEFTGAYAIHPFSGNKIPIWVGDYVLAGYGTGAVMGVPAHDSRDHAFATHFGLDIKQVIAPPSPEGGNSPHDDRSGENEEGYGYETADPTVYGLLKEFSKKHRSVPTESENIFWQLVRGKSLGGYKFRRQHIIGPYIADFVCLQCKLVIEIDGLIHELPEHKTSDEERTHFFNKNGFRVLRFTNNEVIGNPNDVLKRVEIELKTLTKQLPPLGGGGAFDLKEGKCINSDFLNGLEVKDATKRAIEEIEKRNLGKGKVNFRLRDAAFGRQRYWGEPIPIYYKDGIPTPIEESELPLILPEIDNFKPTETGDPPLARAKDWRYKAPPPPEGGNTAANDGTANQLPPSGGGGAYEYTTMPPEGGNTAANDGTANQLPPSGGGGAYEYTTMPGWAGSSWYYLRYMDPNNNAAFASKDAINYWQNIDLYIGGAEHATGHLLYFRFWTKFLNDYGLVPFVEPAKKLVNQGMIQGMSEKIYFKTMRSNVSGLYNNGGIISNPIHPISDHPVVIFLSADIYENVISNSEQKSFYTAVNVPIEMVEKNILDIVAFSKQLREGDSDAVFLVNGTYWTQGKLYDLKNDRFNECSDKTKIGFKTFTEVEKMSKSKWNVVNPDDVIAQYGADTMRMYEMFLGPLELSKPWSTQGISGVYGFLKRFWRMFFVENKLPQIHRLEENEREGFFVSDEKPTAAELKTLHKLIKKVDEDIERLSFNTAVSAFMICLNELYDLKCNKRAILEPLVIVLSPLAPFICEELWSKLGHTESVLKAEFPKFEESYLIENTFSYPVSFNGKTRFMLELPVNLTKEQIEKEVLASEFTLKWTRDTPVKKVIVVPNKIVNVVI